MGKKEKSQCLSTGPSQPFILQTNCVCNQCTFKNSVIQYINKKEYFHVSVKQFSLKCRIAQVGIRKWPLILEQSALRQIFLLEKSRPNTNQKQPLCYVPYLLTNISTVVLAIIQLENKQIYKSLLYKISIHFTMFNSS